MWLESNCTQGLNQIYIWTWTCNQCNGSTDKINQLKKTKDKDTKTKERQQVIGRKD